MWFHKMERHRSFKILDIFRTVSPFSKVHINTLVLDLNKVLFFTLVNGLAARNIWSIFKFYFIFLLFYSSSKFRVHVNQMDSQ